MELFLALAGDDMGGPSILGVFDDKEKAKDVIEKTDETIGVVLKAGLNEFYPVASVTEKHVMRMDIVARYDLEKWRDM